MKPNHLIELVNLMDEKFESLQHLIEENIVERSKNDEAATQSISNERNYYNRMRNLIDPIYFFIKTTNIPIDSSIFSEYLFQVLEVSRKYDTNYIFPNKFIMYKDFLEHMLIYGNEENQKSENLDESTIRTKRMDSESIQSFHKIYNELLNAATVFQEDEKYGKLLKNFATNLVNDTFLLSGHSRSILPYYRSYNELEIVIYNLTYPEKKKLLKKMSRCFKAWMNYIRREYIATK